MKKLITTCALIACASVVSFGQNAKPAAPNANQPQRQQPQMSPEQMQQRQEQMAERQSKFVEKQYGLNSEQYKGVHESNLAFMKSMDAMRAQGKQPSREEMEKLMATRDAGYKKAMSSEQYTKYEATRSKPASMQQNAARPQGAPQPAPVKH